METASCGHSKVEQHAAGLEADTAIKTLVTIIQKKQAELSATVLIVGHLAKIVACLDRT